MAAQPKPSPKRVVYLWGAGATHAEAQHLGARINLLMRDDEKHLGDGIATRILRRMGSNVRSSFGSRRGVDIEKLISLLAGSGTDEHTRLADEMRAAYFAELRSSLATANVLDNPQLAMRLLEMHVDQKFRDEVETLSGIITTNHDGLLQVACQNVFGKVNIGFKYNSVPFTEVNSNSAPPVLQLHGSFTWRFGIPIKVGKLRTNSRYSNTIWIPPTILKESKSYPFNKLSGQAYELLSRHCDVLRVVGASLTQNDWNILSLVFNAQRHREATTGSGFPLELIMPHSTGEWIKVDCAYLKNIISIGYLNEGRFDAYIADYEDVPGAKITPDSDLANPFAYWLNEKTAYHRERGELSPVSTGSETAQALGDGA